MRRMIVLAGVLLLTGAAIAAVADLKPIVDPYVRIQQALNADRVAGIKEDAQAVASEAAKLGASGSAIQSAAGELQQAADLKAARAAFGKLSDAIMIYAKASKASLADDVKIAYCPMVRKYWLQKGEKIQNPFLGQSMSDCGRLNATLPDLK